MRRGGCRSTSRSTSCPASCTATKSGHLLEEAKSYYVDLSGMPGASRLIEHYAEVSGRQVDDMDYYTVLARWKLAIVLEQSVKYGGDSPAAKALGPYVLNLMKSAADLAETSDYRG